MEALSGSEHPCERAQGWRAIRKGAAQRRAGSDVAQTSTRRSVFAGGAPRPRRAPA